MPKCSPFLPLITGARIMTFLPILLVNISLHISVIDLDASTSLWSGQIGVPILAKSKRR